MRSRTSSLVERALLHAATVALAVALVGCAADPVEVQMQSAFDAFLVGVQQIENFSGIDKTRGELDETTTPPSYDVSYSGCADGAVSGRFCIDDGLQYIVVIDEETHLIQSLSQSYRLEGFATDDTVSFDGELPIEVTVGVDSSSESTEIQGSGRGVLMMHGSVEGEVELDLTIHGGRNYTHDTTTLVEVDGVMTHDGVEYPVMGAFARE